MLAIPLVHFRAFFTRHNVFLILTILPASGDLSHLLIIFANSLDPDQAQQNVGPALDPNCLKP